MLHCIRCIKLAQLLRVCFLLSLKLKISSQLHVSNSLSSTLQYHIHPFTYHIFVESWNVSEKLFTTFLWFVSSVKATLAYDLENIENTIITMLQNYRSWLERLKLSTELQVVILFKYEQIRFKY